MLSKLLALLLTYTMPTYPVTPVTIGPATTSFTYGYALANNTVGQFGFQYNSDLYLVLDQGNYGDYSIHVFKSSDGAFWTEMDSSNVPTIGAGSYGNVYTVAVDGSTVWVANIQTTFVSTSTVVTGITMSAFTLTTGTWGTTTTYTSFLPGFTRNNKIVARLLVRGPGDMILFYSSPQEVIGGVKYARCSYVTFNGTSFGTPVPLPGQAGTTTSFQAYSGVVDGSSNAHFFYYASFGFRHTGLDSSGTFGTEQTLPWDVYWGDGEYSDPISYTEGGVNKIAFAGDTSMSTSPFTEQLLLITATAAVTPSWSTSVISSNPETPIPQGFDLIPLAVSLAYLDGTFHLGYTWQDPVTQPESQFHNPYLVYRYTSAPSSTLVWSSPVTIWSPPLRPTDSPTTPYNHAWLGYQVYLFSGSMGVGFLGISDTDFDNYPTAQFYLIGSGTTPPVPHLCIMFSELGKLHPVLPPGSTVSLIT